MQSALDVAFQASHRLHRQRQREIERDPMTIIAFLRFEYQSSDLGRHYFAHSNSMNRIFSKTV